MGTEQDLEVEVAYARELAQALIAVKGKQGMTVAEAIEQSGIRRRFPEIDLAVNVTTSPACFFLNPFSDAIRAIGLSTILCV